MSERTVCLATLVCVDQERRALNRVNVGTVDGKHGRCGERSGE